MEENKSNLRGGGGQRHEHVEAAFHEDLFSCYTCGKIYLTRHPIRLRSFSRRSLHICLECSHSLICSVCGEPVATETAILMENHPDYQSGFLCADCRSRIFIIQPSKPSGLWARTLFAAASVGRAAIRPFQKIVRMRLRLDKKRR